MPAEPLLVEGILTHFFVGLNATILLQLIQKLRLGMGFQTVIFILCRNKEILDSLTVPEHHVEAASGARWGNSHTRLGALTLCTTAVTKIKELRATEGSVKPLRQGRSQSRAVFSDGTAVSWLPLPRSPFELG